jgi:hypothetical protein
MAYGRWWGGSRIANFEIRIGESEERMGDGK